MNVLTTSLRDIVLGNVLGIGVFIGDMMMERAISNEVNRRIAMYIFHMLFAMPVFLIMRHNMRHKDVDFQQESQADTVSYTLSFFSVGLGLYMGYIVRSYLDKDNYG